ncbi:MAG: hypothetical protein V1799_15550 [bacterium]
MMKHFITLEFSFTLLISLSLIMGCSQEPKTPCDITVTYVLPKVKSKKAGEIAWEETTPQSQLGKRDQLQTFKKASATLQIKNDHQIVVRENTLIVINEMFHDTTQRTTTGTLEILSGRVQLKTPDDANFNVDLTYRTPNATANAINNPSQASGNEVLIKADENEKDLFSVLQGTLSVKSQGDSISVGKNFGTFVEKGKKPAPPRPLLPPPVLVTPDQQIITSSEIGRGAYLRWERNPKASMYHVEISGDSNFSKPLFEVIGASLSVKLEPMPVGMNWWRASCMDSIGIEGMISKPRTFSVLGRIFTFPKPFFNGRNTIVVQDTTASGRLYVGGYILDQNYSNVGVVVYAYTDMWYAQGTVSDNKVIPTQLEGDGYWELYSRTSKNFIVLVVKLDQRLPAIVASQQMPMMLATNVIAFYEFIPRSR